MRQLINNPRFVLGMVVLAGLLIAWQYLPVDWGRSWNQLLLGEVAQMTAETEGMPPEAELPVSKLFGLRPKNLPGEWEKTLESTDIDRALFPVPASPAEKKWQQQDEGPRFPAGLRLEAVYQDGNQSVAVLSGYQVREGDYLRGAEVVRISRDRVTFLWMDSQHDLLLGGDTGVLQKPKDPPPKPADSKDAPAPDTTALLQGELERLRQIQKLLEMPANLLKGSEQTPPP